MSLVSRLLRRFGYVRLADYGLTVAGDRIVPLPRPALPPGPGAAHGGYAGVPVPPAPVPPAPPAGAWPAPPPAGAWPGHPGAPPAAGAEHAVSPMPPPPALEPPPGAMRMPPPPDLEPPRGAAPRPPSADHFEDTMAFLTVDVERERSPEPAPPPQQPAPEPPHGLADLADEPTVAVSRPRRAPAKRFLTAPTVASPGGPHQIATVIAPTDLSDRLARGTPTPETDS